MLQLLFALVLIVSSAMAESRPTATEFYASPGTDAIATLPANTEFAVVDTVGNFVLVKLIGYIPLTAVAASVTPTSSTEHRFKIIVQV